MGGTKYYVVVIGHVPAGIFTTWEETRKQVTGVHGAKCKSFPTYQGAKEYYSANGGAVEDVEDLLQREMKALTMKSEDPASALVAFCGSSTHGDDTPDCEAAWTCVFPENPKWDVAKKIDDEEKRTSNRPVYLAAHEALRRANVEDPEQKQSLTIYTSLGLLINPIT